MHQDQRQPAVEHIQDTAVNGHQGYHQHLERDNHRSNHQGKDESAELPVAVTHDNKTRHGRDKNRQNRGTACDDERVAEHRPELHLLHRFREVSQRKAVSTDQCKRILYDIGFGLEDVDDNHDEGENKADKQNQKNDPHNSVGDFLLPCGSFVFSHYASTSPLLPTITCVTPTMAHTRKRITASAWPRP